MRKISVANLRHLLSEVSENAVIVVPDFDHKYRDAHVEVTTAVVHSNEYIEDYGEELTPMPEGGKRIEVVVIS